MYNEFDSLVEQLRDMQRNSKLTLAVDVGRLIVDRIFGGDYSILKQNGHDHVSFRKLAAHPKLPFSKSTLWRYVGVSELAQNFPWVMQANALTTAHLIAVLGLPTSEQKRFLRDSLKNRWTAKDLRKQIGKPIVPRANPVDVFLQKLERAQSELPQDMTDLDRQRVMKALQNTGDWCYRSLASLSVLSEQKQAANT